MTSCDKCDVLNSDIRQRWNGQEKQTGESLDNFCYHKGLCLKCISNGNVGESFTITIMTTIYFWFSKALHFIRMSGGRTWLLGWHLWNNILKNYALIKHQIHLKHNTFNLMVVFFLARLSIYTITPLYRLQSHSVSCFPHSKPITLQKQ